MPIAATWMDLEIVILSEVSQTQRRNIIWHPLYVESKMIQVNLLTKQKETHRLGEWTYDCLGEEIVKDLGMDMYPLLYLKWITYEDLRYSTWKFAQCYVEDEMAGWHHWLDGQEFEWTLGVGDGQGGLVCCGSWGCKKSDTTERLNWTE